MSEKIKPIKKEEVQNFLEETRGLERDYITEILKSRNSAQKRSIFAYVLAAMGLAAGFAGFMQKTPDPLVFKVDSATGNVDIVTTVKDQELTYGEIVDQYWLNKYVLNRESYDYNTIQLNYDTTALLSDPETQKEYSKIYEGPNARDAVIGDKARIIPSIRSIQPNNRGQATIRFTLKETPKNGGLPTYKNMIATIGYKYVNAPMNLADRRINPLGFQVTSYRADPESVL